MTSSLKCTLYIGYFCSSLHKAYLVSGLSVKQHPISIRSKRPNLYPYSLILPLEHHAFLSGKYLNILYASQKNPLVTLVLAFRTMCGTGTRHSTLQLDIGQKIIPSQFKINQTNSLFEGDQILHLKPPLHSSLQY